MELTLPNAAADGITMQVMMGMCWVVLAGSDGQSQLG